MLFFSVYFCLTDALSVTVFFSGAGVHNGLMLNETIFFNAD